jgi:hypothetical protein
LPLRRRARRAAPDEAQADISAEHFAVDICKEWFEMEAAPLTVGKVVAAKPSGREPRRNDTR